MEAAGQSQRGLGRAWLLALKMEEGASSQGVLAATEAGRGKETDSPPEPWREPGPAEYLDFSLVKPFQILTSRKVTG